MANNKISEIIEQLRTDSKGSSRSASLIALLEAKQSELGDDATDSEIEQGIKECLIKHLSETHNEPEAKEEKHEKSQFMIDSTAVVKSFFDDENWHYTERIRKPELVQYDMGFSMKNCSLRVRVYVEDNPKVCRIDAILPITADKTFDLLLCSVLAKENYSKRYGGLVYDERDGELAYSYSYPISHGIIKEDLKRAFHAVINSASDLYPIVKNHAVGKYTVKEKSEIYKRIDDLMNALNDE